MKRKYFCFEFNSTVCSLTLIKYIKRTEGLEGWWWWWWWWSVPVVRIKICSRYTFYFILIAVF